MFKGRHFDPAARSTSDGQSTPDELLIALSGRVLIKIRPTIIATT